MSDSEAQVSWSSSTRRRAEAAIAPAPRSTPGVAPEILPCTSPGWANRQPYRPPLGSWEHGSLPVERDATGLCAHELDAFHMRAVEILWDVGEQCPFVLVQPPGVITAV